MSAPLEIHEDGDIVLPERLLPLAQVLTREISVEGACTLLAELFGVRSSEVALLRLDEDRLRFLYPHHLRNTGAVPLSGPAVAAHTALSKKAEIFNNFALIEHARNFEFIRPSGGHEHLPEPIQKLMSAPIVAGTRNVLGVIQISRKGRDSRMIPDFSRDELHDLEVATEVLASSFLLAQ